VHRQEQKQKNSQWERVVVQLQAMVIPLITWLCSQPALFDETVFGLVSG